MSAVIFQPFCVLLVDALHNGASQLFQSIKGVGDHFINRVEQSADLTARQLQRLSGGGGNLACRTGGDEFQLVCLDIDSTQWLHDKAEALAEAIAQPIRFDGQEIRTSVSVGMALATPGIESGLELVKRADQALYQVKHNGRGKPVLFSEELGRTLLERDQLVADLRVALNDNQLNMFYQPQLDLTTDQLVGFEALIRWNHPTRGLLAPATFLEAAEQNHVLAQIDDIAANEALDTLVALSDIGHGDLKMSLNVSGQTLTDKKFPARLDWAIQSRNLAPSRICVEVQETMVLRSDGSAVAEALQKLKNMGIRIALDDFGTGYAGLAQLSKFDIDFIKLDRSMVSQLDKSRRNRKIIAAIVKLCGELRSSVIAEGVETTTQLNVLRDCECPVIQGYGLAHPMPYDRLMEWLDSFERRTGPFTIQEPKPAHETRLKQTG